MPRTKPRFTRKLFTYLTPEQEAVLRDRAYANGLTPAAFIRRALVDAGLPCDPMPEPRRIAPSVAV